MVYPPFIRQRTAAFVFPSLPFLFCFVYSFLPTGILHKPNNNNHLSNCVRRQSAIQSPSGASSSASASIVPFVSDSALQHFSTQPVRNGSATVRWPPPCPSALRRPQRRFIIISQFNIQVAGGISQPLQERSDELGRTRERRENTAPWWRGGVFFAQQQQQMIENGQSVRWCIGVHGPMATSSSSALF